MQNQIEGGGRCDVLRPILGVRQQSSGAVRLPQWVGVCRKASGRDGRMRLSMEVGLLRGEAVGK